MENVILNGNDITHLITSFEVYEEMDNEHIIGNAVSTQIKLKIKNKDSQLTDQLDYPFVIGTKEYLVYQKPEKWTGTLSLTLYDKMVLTNKPYKTNLVYPVTISQQLDEMSEFTGVVIDKTTLSNEVLSKEVSWYDNSMLIRNYLGFIAQCDGKNAFVENDVVVFKPIASKSHEISFSSGYELNEVITFSRVCFDDGLILLSKGEDIGKTLYVSKENTYIEQSDIDRIYEMYNGLSFYSFKKFKCKGFEDLSLTDLITYHDITVLPFSIKRTVNGGNAKDSIEMSGDMTIANADTVIIKENPNVKIKRLQTIVDQNEVSIEIIARDVNNHDGRIGSLELSTDKIQTSVSQTENELLKRIADLTLELEKITLEVNAMYSKTEFTKGEEIQAWESNEVPTLMNYPTFTDFFIWDYCSDTLYCSDDLICGTNNYDAHENEVLFNEVTQRYYMFLKDEQGQYYWKELSDDEYKEVSNYYSSIMVQKEKIRMENIFNENVGYAELSHDGLRASNIYCC